MKTITLNVSEPVYADFQRYAREKDRSTAELVREAMETYRETKIRPPRSLREQHPVSAGEVLTPWNGRVELLDDLLDSRP